MKTDEKYRVKPGLSLRSKELYRRVTSGTLPEGLLASSDFIKSGEAERLKRMSQTAKIQAVVEGQKKVDSLKSKLNNG